MSKKEWESIWFLLKDILKKEKGRFASMVIFGAAEAILPYISIIGMGKLLDGVYAGAEGRLLFRYALIILVGTLVCHLILNRAAASFWQKLDYTKDLESREMNAKSLSMDYEYLEEEHVQELRSRAFSKSFFGIRGWFFWHMRYILESVVSFLFILCLFLPVIFQKKQEGGGNYRILLLSVVLCFVIGVMVWVNYRSNVHLTRKVNEVHNSMDGLYHKKRYFTELLSGAEAQKDLRMNAQQKEIDKEIAANCEKLREGQLLLNTFFEKRKAVDLVSTSFTGFLIYLFVSFQAYLGLISIGSVVVYASAMVRLADAIYMFSGSIGNMKQMAMYAGDYAEYMGLK